MEAELGDIDERYGWVDRTEACCISVVEGRPPDEVLSMLAMRGAIEIGPAPVRDIREWVWDQDYSDSMPAAVCAVDVGGWTVAFEENGWQGVDRGVAEALSAGTRLAVFSWSVEADMTFVWAVDGEIVRSFDPLLGYDDEGRPKGSGSLPQEDGLPFGLRGPRRASLALIQRLTGISVQPSMAGDEATAVGMTFR